MNRLKSLTAIVATIGPVTDREETLKELIDAGMTVARFNTKHSTPEWHQERIRRVRKVAQESMRAISVLLDLQGPEIRINLPGGQGFEMKEGETALFSSNEDRTDNNLILIPHNVIETLQVGNLVMLDDGLCEFKIIDKGDDYLKVKALGDFPVNHRKTMNTPGIVVDMPSLIPADLEQLDGVTDDDIDYVGLSFVRDVKDIDILKGELEKRNLHAGIISKIENQSALDNIDEIIEASDAVMVARGDLAVEVPFEQLTFWQKLIITKCRFAGTPVITATQMLKSMVDNPRPTRAEVSDIANAIYDGTSAVMLSEETTIGKYAVKAVETQAKIAKFNEKYIDSKIEDWQDDNDPASIAHAAVYMLMHRSKKIDGVVCLTETGRTVELISRFRPQVPVLAITRNKSTYNKMGLYFGVRPYITDFSIGETGNIDMLIDTLRDQDILEKGQTVLLVYGTKWKIAGKTNSLSLLEVK